MPQSESFVARIEEGSGTLFVLKAAADVELFIVCRALLGTTWLEETGLGTEALISSVSKLVLFLVILRYSAL